MPLRYFTITFEESAHHVNRLVRAVWALVTPANAVYALLINELVRLTLRTRGLPVRLLPVMFFSGGRAFSHLPCFFPCRLPLSSSRMVFRLNVVSLYGFVQARPVAFSMNA